MHNNNFHAWPALTRRSFLCATGLAAVAAVVGPEVLSSSKALAASSTPVPRGELLPDLTQTNTLTVLIRFSAPQDAAGALLSATSSDKRSQWSVLLGGGAVQLRAQAPNLERSTQVRFPLAADRRGHLDDGNQHWIAVRVGAEGTDMFVDGQWAHSSTTRSCPHSIGGLTVVTQGAVGGSDGFTEVFPGTISDVIVTSRALNSAAIAAASPTPNATTEWSPDRAYNTQRPLINRLPEAPAMSSFVAGTLYAEFQTDAGGVMSILSAGDTTQDSTDLTLALNNGAFVIEHRVKGTSSMKFTVPGTWNDGRRHSVCLTTSPFGTIIYADGSEIERHTSTAFLQSLSGMNGLWIGGNIDSNGEQWKFTGTIGQVKIFNWSLSPQQVASVSRQPVIESLALFDNGFAGSAKDLTPVW